MRTKLLMMLVVFCLVITANTGGSASQDLARAKLAQPVHTYSIVARDPATGDMGVAVQSHWFSVGSMVTWGEAGVGVVATQSNEVRFQSGRVPLSENWPIY